MREKGEDGRWETIRSFVRCSSGGDRIAAPAFVLLGNLRFNRGIKRKTPRPAPRRARTMQPNAYLNEAGVRCRGGKDGCDSAMVSTVPIIALLRAAGFAETAMVNGCERFAFNVVPYNLNLDSDNARSSNFAFADNK